MNKTPFVILLMLILGCLLVQAAKKEEKSSGNAVAKANTNLLEYIQLFKSLLNQALSKGIHRFFALGAKVNYFQRYPTLMMWTDVRDFH